MSPPAEGSAAELTVRRATVEDRTAVLRLLSASLGWVPDESFERFFVWKHERSPFGPSPAWVALDRGDVVGFRTFMRWELEGAGRAVWRAVRAVDTATHPAYQGRGIFRRLTLHALGEMAGDGVDLVFNTPNAKSRPGYLTMGWSELGRLPVAVVPRSPAALVRMARARVPAERWSEPSTAGRPAVDVLATQGVEELLASRPPPRSLRTNATAAFVQWRYGFAPLAYRAVTLGADAAEGLAVFRVRRRGGAREAAVCLMLAPAAEQRAERALARAVVRASGADYAIRLGGGALRGGYVRLPGQGPVLTWRAVQGEPPGGQLADWDLALGDVELF